MKRLLNGIKMLTLSDLLYNILLITESRYGRKTLPKTNLLKLAYLAEVEYYRTNQQRLTDTKWIYYKFGPYNMDYDTTLAEGPFVIEYKETSNSEMQLVCIDSLHQIEKLNKEQTSALNRIVRYSKNKLDEILDYVYFETEPMINASERLQILDFSTIPPQRTSKYFENDKLTPEMEKHLRKKFIELMKMYYTYRTEWSIEDNCFISRVLEFPSLSAFGDTREESIKELDTVLHYTLEWMKEEGEKISAPITEKEYTVALEA